MHVIGGIGGSSRNIFLIFHGYHGHRRFKAQVGRTPLQICVQHGFSDNNNVEAGEFVHEFE